MQYLEEVPILLLVMHASKMIKPNKIMIPFYDNLLLSTALDDARPVCYTAVAAANTVNEPSSQ
jgi:hypothetical protein